MGPAMRREDGGVQPSLGGKLVIDSWDVNGVFVWGLMMGGGGGGSVTSDLDLCV